MTQPIGLNDFHFLNKECEEFKSVVKEFKENHGEKYTEESSYGYFLTIDINIPPEIHKKLQDFPPMTEMRPTNYNELSNYTKNLLKKSNMKMSNCPKLIADLKNKRNYTTNYLNLKFFLKLGCQLLSISSIVKFRQTIFLREYVLKNSKARMEAKSNFEKDYFKLKVSLILNATIGSIHKSVRSFVGLSVGHLPDYTFLYF